MTKLSPTEAIARGIARWRNCNQVMVRASDTGAAGLVVHELEKAGYMIVKKNEPERSWRGRPSAGS